MNGLVGGSAMTRVCSTAGVAAAASGRLRPASARATSPSHGHASLMRCQVSTSVNDWMWVAAYFHRLCSSFGPSLPPSPVILPDQEDHSCGGKGISSINFNKFLCFAPAELNSSRPLCLQPSLCSS